MATLLRRIWKSVKANKALVIAVIALGFLEAFFTKAPAILVKPLLEAVGSKGGPLVIGDGDWLMRAYMDYARWLVDLVGFDTTRLEDSWLVLYSATISALVLGLPGALAMYGVLVYSRYFATKVVVDLRDEVAAHILKLPLRFFGLRRMGELISSLTTNTTALTRAFALACDHVIVDPMLILWNAILILIVLPEAAWILVAMVPLMAIPMIRLGRRVQKSSQRSMVAMGDATESMNQILSGIKTVKAFQLEDRRMADFAENNARYLRRTKNMLRAKGISQAALYFTYQLGFAALLIILGWLLLRGSYRFSDLGVVLLPLTTTYTHVKRLSRAYNTLNESVGILEAVEDILHEPIDAAHGGKGIVVERFRGAVELQHVSFHYDREPVLHDVSFRVEPGQTVALVGPSGGGKSTTLDLIARFHDPQQGRILIDGHDLKDLDLVSFRRQLAVVSQQPFLFNTTIFENIRCGRPEATHDEVVDAARNAQIHDFIASLPQDYETLAGERGCNLSGGQMQRITIARAIVRDPRFLLLDEATSALDSESEELVQKALQNLMRGRTCFVIAHRLATVRNADVILVLERGRIVERGTHDALLSGQGLYNRLTQLQQLA
jgi:subfamily B ATP-binding cassette protein MsbA